MNKGTKILVFLLLGAMLLRFGMFLGRSKPQAQNPPSASTNTAQKASEPVEATSCGRLVALLRMGTIVTAYVVPDGQRSAISFEVSASDIRYDAILGVVTIAGRSFRYNEKPKDVAVAQPMKSIFGGPTSLDEPAPKAAKPFALF